MNILLIGSGAREHALAWKMSQSKMEPRLFFLPGNPGMLSLGENIPLSVSDFEAIGKTVLERSIHMVVVGPEEPLVKGLHDYFLEHPLLCQIPFIGPARKGAMLEGSKDFAKGFMGRHGIPTAAYKSFRAADQEAAFDFLKTLKPPYVLKADGLAAGKGVLIVEDYDEAVVELREMFSGRFGEAGNTVVIESFLRGIEVSVFALTDGEHYIILPEAKDYKRIGERDTGPNTGGMGSVSPVSFADKTFMQKVEDRIIRPTILGLKEENIPYKGFIFFGLISVEGEPYVIEYNVRMGDPETESVMLRLKSDLVALLEATSMGTLDQQRVEIDERTAVTVMMVSGGYPGGYTKGLSVEGLDRVEGSLVFHAGTVFSGDEIVTSGGRVLAVSSYGETLDQALALSMKNAAVIRFQGAYYRKDIGFDIS